jgi:hypothetical protein
MSMNSRENIRRRLVTVLAVISVGAPSLPPSSFANPLPNAFGQFALIDNAEGADVVFTESIGSDNPISHKLGALSPTAGGTLTTGAIDPAAAVTISGLNPPYLTVVNVPQLTSSTIMEGVHENSAETSVYVNYNFTAVGPPNIQVPLDLWINHGVTPNGIVNEIGTPDANFSVQGSNDVIFVGAQNGVVTSQTLGAESLDIENHPLAPPEDTFSKYISSYSPTGFITIDVTSDSINSIEMNANSYVSLGAAEIGSASINTIVDPYITIDPSVPLAAEFTLGFSPFIGNDLVSSGPVSAPEPSTLTLLGTAGLSALSLALLRRRARYTSMLPEPLA